MNHGIRFRVSVLECGCALLILIASSLIAVAARPLDEQSPWPRVRSTNGNTVTLHLPQVERWTSNSFTARAAVEVKLANVKSEILGAIWLDAHGTVDRSNRVVTLDRIEITKSRFPDAGANTTNALAVLRQVIPSGDVTVSLDYLITALGFDRAAARQGPRGLKNTPPTIIWTTNRTVLVIVDGDPVLRAITNSSLERVINTPSLLIREKDSSKFYLSGDGQWFAAPSLSGPWALAQTPPAEVAALIPPGTNSPPAPEGPAAKIIVSTKPAELLMTSGFPEFRPIRGTALQYAADSDSQLFFYTTDRDAYLLLSGRWFKANSLKGPWSYVAPHDLPSDFARIPPGTPQGVVLASVPNTPQAELALLANSVPTTATVNRREASIQLSYDGDPKFKPIEGTSMSYAINAQLPVIHSGESYYALQDGVWFVAPSPTGPWQVAAEVPEEIYTIPPSSPVYYATYARILDANDDEVEVGYTAGYQGAYEEDGTEVYGTGWDYEPYYGDDYYGWGWTWGYGYVYVPWWQWWCWRPWWGPAGGLRAALIENIYDRWQGGNQVIHHDRPPGAAIKRPVAFSGYPALYGRFKGSARPAPMTPPPNTLALNPYTRPASQVRSGETPRGAQLLSTVRQSPGAGRDLYASPDGNVYRRKDDGWYRREAGGNWKLFAPTQGQMQNERSVAGAAAARGGQLSDAGNVYRPAATAAANRREAASGTRVPDVGNEARAQEVADLERQYYARSLAQMRAQNYPRARVGGGGRRR